LLLLLERPCMLFSVIYLLQQLLSQNPSMTSRLPSVNTMSPNKQ
jgi:hypothetical protein